MPYDKMGDVNSAIKGIDPKVMLAQANLIASWADAMEKADDGPENPWAATIAQFKRLYEKSDTGWAKRESSASAVGLTCRVMGYVTSRDFRGAGGGECERGCVPARCCSPPHGDDCGGGVGKVG